MSENSEMRSSGHSDLSPMSAGESNSRQTEMPLFCYDAKPEMFPGMDYGSRPMMDEANKLYVCHLCDFRTAFRNSLLNHQAVHSDSRPWVCAMCDYAAKRKQDLKKHLHTIHGMMVDSTMLKPVETNQSNSSSTEENNSSDSSKVSNRQTEVEAAAAAAATFLTKGGSGDATMTNLRSPGRHDMMQNFVKQEIASPNSSHFLPRTTPESDNKTADDSPDDDLPISFPPVPPSNNLSDNQTSDDDHPHSLPQTYQGPGPASNKFYENKAKHGPIVSPNFSPMSMSSPPINNSRSPYNHDLPQNIYPATQNRKRHYFRDGTSAPYPEASGQGGIGGVQMRLGPPLTKRPRSPEREETPCSSSAGSAQIKASQTPTSFMCDHCNIMFFQRAMYLMHMGLHSSENPWQCTVCGGTFTEVYSFTSHFINQH